METTETFYLSVSMYPLPEEVQASNLPITGRIISDLELLLCKMKIKT